MSKDWKVEQILELSRGFQPAAVLAAAVDLDLFTAIGKESLTADQIAGKLNVNLRGITILLDALGALGLLDKQSERYSVPPSVLRILTRSEPGNVLAMAQHQANCMRRWGQLAWIIKNNSLPPRGESIRGADADHASFIEAMDNLSAPIADNLIAQVPPLAFRHLLDVGGASGSWTIAWLRKYPEATATLFDLPAVIPMADARLTKAGLRHRVKLLPGDFLSDPLPPGADLAWVSAIVHQNSRQQNRKLFGNIAQALIPSGKLLIRDIVMEESKTEPQAGALFAVNMLSATESGGTYTFRELSEDLLASGLAKPQFLRRDPGMHALVLAEKAG